MKVFFMKSLFFVIPSFFTSYIFAEVGSDQNNFKLVGSTGSSGRLNDGQCKTDLTHLRGKFPKFDNAMLVGAASGITNSSTLRDAIAHGKSTGDSPYNAAKVYLRMAEESDKQSNEAARNSRIFAFASKSDDEVLSELNTWKHGETTCNDGYSGQMQCAAILFRLQAIGFRAVAAELACFGTKWPSI